MPFLTHWRIPLALLGLTVLCSSGGTAQEPAPVQSVPSVDLTRYLGSWYEVARLPNTFQKKCARETVAEYSRLPDGDLRVVNTCRKSDGSAMLS